MLLVVALALSVAALPTAQSAFATGSFQNKIPDSSPQLFSSYSPSEPEANSSFTWILWTDPPQANTNITLTILDQTNYTTIYGPKNTTTNAKGWFSQTIDTTGYKNHEYLLTAEMKVGNIEVRTERVIDLSLPYLPSFFLFAYLQKYYHVLGENVNLTIQTPIVEYGAGEKPARYLGATANVTVTNSTGQTVYTRTNVVLPEANGTRIVLIPTSDLRVDQTYTIRVNATDTEGRTATRSTTFYLQRLDLVVTAPTYRGGKLNVTIFGLTNYTSVTLQIYAYNSTPPSYYQQITHYNQTLSFTAGRVDVTNLDTSSFWIDVAQGYQFYYVTANVSSLYQYDAFSLSRFSVIMQLNQSYSYTTGDKVTVTVSTKLAQAGADLNLTVERSINTFPYYEKVSSQNRTLDAAGKNITSIDTTGFSTGWYLITAKVTSGGVSITQTVYFYLNPFTVSVTLNRYTVMVGGSVNINVSTRAAQSGATLNLTIQRYTEAAPYYQKISSQNKTLDAAGRNITTVNTSGFTSGSYQILATVYSQGVQAAGYAYFSVLAFNVTLELNQAVAGGYATPKLTIKTSPAQTNANISIRVDLYGVSAFMTPFGVVISKVDATTYIYFLPLAGRLLNGTAFIMVEVESSAGEASGYASLAYSSPKDSDGDGLPDNAETAIETDPSKIDSGTGYPDGLAWFEGVVRAPVLIRVNPTTNVLVLGFIAVNGTGFGDGESIAIYLAGRIIKNATATAQGLLREVLIEIPNGTLTGTYTVYAVGRTTGLTSNSVQIAVVGKSISFEQVAPQIVNITVAGAPVQLSVKTNATLANLVYNETVKKMTFEIAGPTGTKGVANLAPPISLFPTGDVRVLVDGSPASDAQITKNSTHLNIRLTVTFASVKTITIEQVAAAAVLDLTTILAVVVGVVVVVAVVGVVLMKRRKKTLEAPPATPSTPQPGVKFEALN